MLSNEAREMMIKAYEKTGNAKEVAECYGVDVSTVYRLARQKKRTGSVKLRTKALPSSKAEHPIESAYFHYSHLKRKADYGHQVVCVLLSCNWYYTALCDYPV